MMYVGHVFVQSPQFRPSKLAITAEEHEAELRWEYLFANSQDALAKLAEKAHNDYMTGKVEPLDPEKL